jgi:hypothetical protein
MIDGCQSALTELLSHFDACGAGSSIPTFDLQRFQTDVRLLTARERPFFEAAAACGACGAKGLSDAGWLDFLSYIHFKALAAQLQPSRGSPGWVIKCVARGGTHQINLIEPPSRHAHDPLTQSGHWRCGR